MNDEIRKALVFVELYRRRHGYGPTWGELGKVMGWFKYQERNEKIRALRVHGLRWRSGVERSLEVRPEALRTVLRELREERVA